MLKLSKRNIKKNRFFLEKLVDGNILITSCLYFEQKNTKTLAAIGEFLAYYYENCKYYLKISANNDK